MSRRLQPSPPHDKKSGSPIIIFDGVCNFCEISLNFVIRHDAGGKFRFAPAQSAAGSALQARYKVSALKEETFVLVKGGRAYTRSDAAIEVARELDGRWRWLALLGVLPRPLREGLYRLVARHRYRLFGKKRRCMVPETSISGRFLS